jgi:hypothetical protein
MAWEARVARDAHVCVVDAYAIVVEDGTRTEEPKDESFFSSETDEQEQGEGPEPDGKLLLLQQEEEEWFSVCSSSTVVESLLEVGFLGLALLLVLLGVLVLLLLVLLLVLPLLVLLLVLPLLPLLEEYMLAQMRPMVVRDKAAIVTLIITEDEDEDDEDKARAIRNDDKVSYRTNGCGKEGKEGGGRR